MRINKIFIHGLLFILLFILSTGCAQKRFKDDTLKTQYQCENGFDFISEIHKSQGKDQVILNIEDSQLVLDITPSASGIKYTDGINTFWAKGDSAILELADNKVYNDCSIIK